jgi:aldehyde dehydrogenase (NAD+)
LVHEADSVDQALALVNGTAFGLSTAIYTRDLNAALSLAAHVRSGLVRVNASTTGLDVHVPFGGLKDSAYGPPELGPRAPEFFTSGSTVTVLPHPEPQQ